MPRALFLCSGTGSVGEPFRESGWEVIDVDWDGRFNAEIQTDITTWDYKAMYEPGHFDVVWASPDCRHYSIARANAQTPRDFDNADKLVLACRSIIEYLQPRCWFIENPDTGYLKTRAVIQGLPYVRVDYCMYGADYKKRTRIWTNCDWIPKLCDRSHCVDGKHKANAQHSYKKSDPRYGERTFTRDELHRLPRALCDEIFTVCTATGPGPYRV